MFYRESDGFNLFEAVWKGKFKKKLTKRIGTNFQEDATLQIGRKRVDK